MKTKVCPECGNKVWHNGGCWICPVCGYSPCKGVKNGNMDI